MDYAKWNICLIQPYLDMNVFHHLGFHFICFYLFNPFQYKSDELKLISNLRN